MIRYDTVNGAVTDTLLHRQPVGLLPKRGIHAVIRIPCQQLFLRQQEVMGAGFTGYLYAPCLCLADQLHAADSAHMGNVDPGAGFLRQPDFPGGNAVF